MSTNEDEWPELYSHYIMDLRTHDPNCDGFQVTSESDHKQYPHEWIRDADGCPTCTGFEPKIDEV